MGSHDGGVDHQPFQIGFARQRGKDGVQHPHLDPAIVAPLHRLVLAQRLRQIAPTPARARHPQQRIEKTTVVRARPALVFSPSGEEPFQPSPLVVPKRVDIPNHQS
jgi:hypothetical protein